LALSRIFWSYLGVSFAWVCREQKNLVFIVTTKHPLQLENIWEVLSPTELRWHCCILTLENFVYGHNTVVSPSGAGTDSFAGFSSVAFQLSTADSLIQGPASLQAWPKGPLWLVWVIGCSRVLLNVMLSGFWAHRINIQSPYTCIQW
jgi:hypothetical protein